MRGPTLTELPPPPPGHTGWPWTEDSPQLPYNHPDDAPWPRVCIVTPSYNQMPFVEETIRSVLLQGYPNLEYIIIDGGSTDGSMEIIRKYEPWLAYWVSERDRGQSHAINKGVQRGQGEIVAWLNSDDLYTPGALHAAALALAAQPQAAAVCGDCTFIDANSRPVRMVAPPEFDLRRLLLHGNSIPQPAVFIRRATWDAVGGVDERLHYFMDYDLWLRLGLVGPFARLPQAMACFRQYVGAKTYANPRRWPEAFDLLNRFFARPDLPADIGSLQEPALARAHWLAAMDYLAAGETEPAQRNARDAVALGVLAYDRDAAIGQLICDPHDGSLRSPDWVTQALATLSLPAGVRREAAGRFHASRFFGAFEQRDWAAVRSSAGPMLRSRPRWLANRGVWSILAQAGLASLRQPSRTLRAPR